MKMYEDAELEVISFATEDVIVTSDGEDASLDMGAFS